MNKTLAIVAEDGSSPAVSCLKFEPRVSNFPIQNATMASLFG